jgi:hypothetical protein
MSKDTTQSLKLKHRPKVAPHNKKWSRGSPFRIVNLLRGGGMKDNLYFDDRQGQDIVLLKKTA